MTYTEPLEDSDMASDQFILEIHDKLHPEDETAVHDVDDLTGDDVEEIMAVLDDKHAVRLGSDWISDEAVIELRVFRNILTLASSAAYDGVNEHDEMKLGDFIDGHGKIDEEAVKDWEQNREYYQEQIDAVKVVERQLTEKLTAATCQPGFYLRGIEVDGKVGS